MSEKEKSPAADTDPAHEWAKLWQTMAESSNRMVETWSGSMAPFMLARLSGKPVGFGDGNELSAAIERMAPGPQLADVWDIDRKMALAFGAWVEMRQRLANYNAVASAPCSRALGAQIGSKDYTEIPMPGRHVGLFVSSKSQGKLSQSIAGSLVARDASPVSEA